MVELKYNLFTKINEEKQNQEKFVCLSEIGKILIGSIEICFSIIYLFQNSHIWFSNGRNYAYCLVQIAIRKEE